jgi:N-formylmaleamate deformylase
MHAELPRITIPMALIRAGKGGVILDEDVEEIRRLAPALEIRTVQNAGHQMQVDDLEGFLAAVGSVLGVKL